MSLAATLALAARQQQQIVTVFRSRRALNGATALRLRELGLTDSKELRSMVGASILRRAGPERFFLDESAWASRRNVLGSTAVRVGVALALAAAAAAVYLGGR